MQKYPYRSTPPIKPVCCEQGYMLRVTSKITPGGKGLNLYWNPSIVPLKGKGTVVITPLHDCLPTFVVAARQCRSRFV